MSFLSRTNLQQHSRNSNSSLFTSPTARILYLDWSENSWICNCNVITFISWLVEEGKWLADVSGYHDVICYDTFALGIIRLNVYIDGKINQTTLKKLLNRCIKIDVTSSLMTSNEYYATMLPFLHISQIYNTTASSTTIFQENSSNSSSVYHSLEQSLSPHLAAIIAILIIVDVLAYLIIAFTLKKRLFCKFKSSSVSP